MELHSPNPIINRYHFLNVEKYFGSTFLNVLAPPFSKVDKKLIHNLLVCINIYTNKKHMFHLACTRFNNQTYKENTEYRLKSGEKALYGPAFKIRNTYSAGSILFVVEMNNETNKIEGIGLIKNSLVSDKRYKIYENSDYNRYIYRGKYWLSRAELNTLDPEIVEIFDNILFKGKSNLKRMSGITVLTEKLFTNWNYELTDLKKKVKTTFIKHFQHDVHIEEEKKEGQSELELEKT